MVHYSNHTVTTETRALFETNKTATPKMAFPPQAKITKQKMLINLLFRINCMPFLFFRCNSMLNMAIFSLKKTTSDLLYQEIHFFLFHVQVHSILLFTFHLQLRMFCFFRSIQSSFGFKNNIHRFQFDQNFFFHRIETLQKHTTKQ